MQIDLLIERIKQLPPEKIVEVKDFVEFLWQRSAKQAQAGDQTDHAVELKSIVESMVANTFTGDPPRFSREELHERR